MQNCADLTLALARLDWSNFSHEHHELQIMINSQVT